MSETQLKKNRWVLLLLTSLGLGAATGVWTSKKVFGEISWKGTHQPFENKHGSGFLKKSSGKVK